MKFILLLIALLSFSWNVNAQSDTYKIDKTEYFTGRYYSTTGKPMVKRSDTNKREFLKSKGYDEVPYGYEVDHIIPLSKGGTDDPSNMQLLTKEQHATKTAKERANNSNSTYSGYSTYKVNSTSSSTPVYKSNNTFSNSGGTYKGKTIHTGPKGGQYYINSKGNKTYIKKK